MLLDVRRCFAGFEERDPAPFRLGILGFDSAAESYCERALAVDEKSRRNLDISVFAPAGSIAWCAAKSAFGKSANFLVLGAEVTAIFPGSTVDPEEPLFVVETSAGSFPVDDLFLCGSGRAIDRP